MSIELDPAELTFQRPFTREVSQTLHIRNSNIDPIVFKVKTTAPKQYCVRPNSGRIESGKEVEVQVLLQAMKSDPPADFKCRDKFLVQSISITADREATNVQQIWSHVEKTEKSAIRERKIRVVYLQPGENSNSAVGEASFDSSPPPYTSPTPLNDAHSTPAPIQRSVVPREAPFAGETASTHSTRSGDDNSELTAAKATIARLEAELKSQGLRQRKPSGAALDAKEGMVQGTAGMGMTTHPPEGISVQVCAALCLFAFSIAWFFF